MNKTLLEVRDLKTYFYTGEGVVKAVDGVTFDIKEGEIFCLVGETGCGKSVTSLSIMRLVPKPGKIVGGKIFFKGKNLLELSEDEMRKIRGKEISMIFQNPMTSLNPVYTVGFQIAEPIMIHQKLKKREAWKKAIEMIAAVKIPDPEARAKSYPHQLSGGMRQRAMIAMMLSCNPSLLIADEPTTALDVTIQAQILELMKELREKFNTSILMITHDLGVVAEIADRVGVMYAGNIVELADVESIFENPKHPYTQGLLRTIPTKGKKKSELEIIPGNVPNLVNPPPGCRFHPRCKYAMEICKKEKPKMIEIEKGHFVACHLYRGDSK